MELHAFRARPQRLPWAIYLRRLRRSGVITSWDFGWDERLPGRRGFQQLAAAVDYLFMNEGEAVMYARARTLNGAIDWWRKRRERVIVKLGAHGSCWIRRDGDVHVPAARVAVADTTGAGDAFNGGVLAALSRGLSPRECLRLGNRLGAASTRRLGGLDGLPPRQ